MHIPLEKLHCVLRSPHLPVKAAAQSPVSIHKEVDGCKQQHHGHWIIKETQHKDGVDPIRSTAHKEEHIGRNLVDKKEKYIIMIIKGNYTSYRYM